MGCVLDTPDALRPTGKRRNVIKTATMREVMKYGGWRKAVEAGVELPPMGGGAVTLVNSGTVTPTVGTNNTVATDTPGQAQMYVVEVDCENMQSGDHLAVGVRRGTTKQTVNQVLVVGGAVASVIPAASLIPQAGSIGGASPGTPAAGSDTQGNSYTAITGASRIGASIVAGILRARLDSALQADWLNDQIGLAPAYQNVAADSITANGMTEQLWSPQLAWGSGAAYATANAASTTVTTSASVAAGDLALAAAGSATSSGSPVANAGWTSPVGGAGGAVSSYQVAGSTGTLTYTPTGTTITNAAIAAFPAMTGLLIGKAVFRGNQAQHSKQSTAFLINASEQVSFDIFQFAGTARSFPWRLYHL